MTDTNSKAQVTDDMVERLEWETPADRAKVLTLARKLWNEDQYSCAWSDENREHYIIRAAMLIALAAQEKPEPGVAVPDGWKLVPVEPTREMWAAMADNLYGYKNRHHDKVAGDLYRAMLAVAPSPDLPEGEVET